MHRTLWGRSLLPAIILLAGCGRSEHDALVKESIACWEEAARVLETIKDRGSGLAAEPKLKRILARLEELNHKARQLPELSPEALQALEFDNDEASTAALSRVREASNRALDIPGCRDIVVPFNLGAARLALH